VRPAALALLIALSATARASERDEALLYASCPRQAGEYVGSYRGRILLHDALLAALGPRPEAIRRSIVQQLRYLWGWYRNEAAAHAQMQVSLGAEEPRIEILSEKRVPYGRELSLSYGETEARLALEDDYTKRGVARGKVGASDPAMLVEFVIHFPLALCGRGEDPPPTVRVPLPPDPWLAYWHVGKERFRPLRYHYERAITNPCADDDFADLPHPYYYWYDWLPTRHGPDDDGKPFDCRQWLKEGVDYGFFDVRLERVRAQTHDFSRLRAQLADGPFTATVIIGVVDHGLKALDTAPLVRGLGRGDGVLDARAKALAASRAWEAGTRSFLDVLAELPRYVRIEHHEARADDGNLVVEVHGRLLRSDRAVRLRFALGLTDVFGPVPPRHWKLLRRALAEDRLVAYWGHSGIGENLKLAQIEKNLGVSHARMSAELERSPLRMVAIISCYSYMYFGEDLLAAGAERADGAYFLFTGTEAPKKEAGPLALFELVDAVLAPDNPSGRIDRISRVGPDELWLVKEVRGKKLGSPGPAPSAK
jgi:hypothetical protein